MSTYPSPLIVRLEQMRRRVRRLLFLIGLGWTLVAVLLCGMAAVTTDYLFGLPTIMRWGLLVIGSLGTVAAFYWLAIRPLLLPLSVPALAQHLQGQFPDLDDRLASAVQFLLYPQTGSPALVQQALAEAEEKLHNVPLEKALNWRPVKHALAAAGGMLLLAVGLVAVDTASARIGLTRLVMPWAGASWPKWVQIATLTGSAKVPLGESFTAAARLERGDQPGARLWIVSADGHDNVERHLMSRQSDGRYGYVFESVVAPLRYYFEARGDSTAENPAQLTVVERPRVVELSAVVTPPVYVTGREPHSVLLDQTSVAFTQGSKVELRMKANNPLVFGGKSVLQPVGSPGTTQPAPLVLAPDPGDPCVGVAKLMLDSPCTFRPQLIDNNELTNRDTSEYRLACVPDEIPTVVITEPRGEVERTPNALLTVAGSAEDDFALTTLKLVWNLQTAAPDSPVSGEITLFSEAKLESRGDRMRGSFSYVWDLAKLAIGTGPVNLKPGDVIAYRVETTDNYVGPHQERHPPGKSAEYKIKIVAPERIAQIVRDEISAAKSRGRAITLDQTTLKDDTSALTKDLAQGQPLTDTDKEQLTTQHDRQSRLSAQTTALANQVREVKKLMEDNRLQDEEGKTQLKEVAEQLGQVSRETMTRSAHAMQDAKSGKAAKEQLEHVQQAVKNQDEAIAGMQTALAKLDRWGEFADIIRNAQEILDRQQQLSGQTGETGQKLLGKPSDSLTEAEKNKLNALAGQQDQLRKETQELLRRMEDLKTRTQPQDPASADALGRAGETARNQDVTGQMNQAAQETRDNRLGQAQNNQQNAQSTLTDMIQQLEKRQERELAELEKKVGQLKDAVEQLMREQEKLTKENQKIQQEKDDALRRQQQADLAARQELNRRNAAQVAQQMADVPQAAAAAGATRKASSEMSRASGKLSGGQGQEAEADQKDAEKDLKQALDELEKLQKQVDEEKAKRSRAAIRERLTALQETQKKTLHETTGIETRRQERGRLLRKDQTLLSELKTGQEKWLKELDQVRGLTAQAEVFDWTLERCKVDGKTVSGRFDNEDTSRNNQVVQSRIIERLGDLIEALKEEKPEEGFKQSGGGGGGGGGGQKPPVPPLAELKMLRTLQNKINKATQEADQRYNKAGEVKSDEGLKEMERIGVEQGELKDLTKRKVEKVGR